ncbi:MAG TPA: hypothetical protein VF168_11590 [Trueperaceae bacterium]
MKPALRHLLVCALLLVAGIGAQAQGDEVLERYGLSLVNLSESVRLLDSDVAASRDELDSAAGALRFLATEAGNPSLIPALERVFERARTAIANRSATDLAVQNALIRGGFQRAVFDSALARLGSEPAVARARLQRLAADLGFTEETSAGIAESTSAGEVRRLFEAALASSVGRKLETAQAQYQESQDAAYRTLAGAYGDFLLIQDSPRAPMQFNEQFAAAATSLVENRSEELATSLTSLVEGFQQLAQAASAQPVEGAPSGGQPVAQAGQQETEGPAAQSGAAAEVGTNQQSAAAQPGTEGQQVPAAQAESATAEPKSTEVAEMPAVSLGQVQANQAAPATEQPQGEAGEGASQQTPAQEEATTPEEPEAGLQPLRVELIATGVPPSMAAEVAARLDGRGVTSLSAALDGLYAQAGRVVAAVQAGEASTARSALETFSTAYETRLQPALELISPAVDDRVAGLVESLASVPVLRAQDTLVLLGQVDAIADLLAGEPSSNVQIINTEATKMWAGWIRVAALIVLALLAVVPLYLLNLAFGGGNRNWQLIGVALFLLLLPVIYEGLASVGAVAAHYSGIDELGILLGFSMFHNPIAQVVWVAITAAAIGFAVAGLYGICVQFGLLGGRRGTVSDSQTLRSTAVVPDADTVVDWDEEF